MDPPISRTQHWVTAPRLSDLGKPRTRPGVDKWALDPDVSVQSKGLKLRAAGQGGSDSKPRLPGLSIGRKNRWLALPNSKQNTTLGVRAFRTNTLKRRTGDPTRAVKQQLAVTAAQLTAHSEPVNRKKYGPVRISSNRRRPRLDRLPQRLRSSH